MSNATNELALAPESFSPLRTCNNEFARVLQNAQLQSYITSGRCSMFLALEMKLKCAHLDTF
jgi:hypothetical protein